MSSIHSKALYLASAVVVALTVALAPALRAAPPVDGQPASAPPMDHSTMAKGDRPMTGNAGATPDMMQHDGQAGMMQHDGKMDMMQHHQQMMAKMHQMQGNVPMLPGQDAFGAIGEIVAMLEADPKTDWSKIDLEALRQHLIDMNDVTLQADVVTKPVDGGLEMAVTGSGRTLAAIRRMVPAHAGEIDGRNGWTAKTARLDNGVLLTVTASDAKEVAHIRGLGFIGILVSGSHHQPHHLAMAKGEPIHAAGGEHAQHVH
jgi:hypothetical protein